MNYVLVGYGHIGKRHESAINSIADSSLIAIIDPVQTHLTIPVFKTIDEFLNSDLQVDAAILASPNGLHFSQAKLFINQNIHVVIEKPMTLNFSQAEELNLLAKNNKVEIFVVMQLRFSPIIKWIKQRITNQDLGKIYLVNVNCFWNRNEDYYLNKPWHGSKEMDGGVLYTQFTHFADIIFHLFGEIKNVNTKLYNFTHQKVSEFPDSGTSNFQFSKGGAGSFTFTTSTFEKNFESYFTIIAEKGTLKVNGQYMNELLFSNIQNIEKPCFIEDKDNLHQRLHEHVFEVVKEGKTNLTSGKDGAMVIKMIDSIYKNHS